MFRIPDARHLLVYDFNGMPDVESFIYWLRDHFIRPVAVWCGTVKRLPLKEKLDSAPKDNRLLIALAGPAAIAKAEAEAVGAYLEFRKGRPLLLSLAGDRAVLERIIEGHHLLSQELISSLVPSLPLAGTRSETWLGSEWQKVRQAYQVLAKERNA